MLAEENSAGIFFLIPCEMLIKSKYFYDLHDLFYVLRSMEKYIYLSLSEI